MTSPAPAHDGALREAAEIAAAMLRFQEPLAHLVSKHTPEGMPIIGVDSYSFVPSPRPIPRTDVATYLTTLPSPAFLTPTTMRGTVAVLLLHELGGQRRTAMEHELQNQTAILSQCARGSDSDRVLLEFDDESYVFSLAALRLWAQRYLVLVGWSVAPYGDRTRAEWQLLLLGGDGRRYSKGWGRPGQDQG